MTFPIRAMDSGGDDDGGGGMFDFSMLGSLPVDTPGCRDDDGEHGVAARPISRTIDGNGSRSGARSRTTSLEGRSRAGSKSVE